MGEIQSTHIKPRYLGCMHWECKGAGEVKFILPTLGLVNATVTQGKPCSPGSYSGLRYFSPWAGIAAASLGHLLKGFGASGAK